MKFWFDYCHFCDWVIVTFVSNIIVFMLSKLSCHQNRTQLELFKLVKLEFCVSKFLNFVYLSWVLSWSATSMQWFVVFILFILICFALSRESWLGRKNGNQIDRSSTTDIWSCCSILYREWFLVWWVGWWLVGERSGASVESLKWVVNSPHFLLHFQDTLVLMGCAFLPTLDWPRWQIYVCFCVNPFVDSFMLPCIKNRGILFN